jgi:uncharacterized membrane protein YedE/YeeE
VVVFVAGLVFALGLGVAGMTNANKVIAFLDVGGPWDPSLAFVMMGAIGVHFFAYRIVPRMERPLFAPRFGVPSRSDIDGRLLLGAGLFGVGWALGGYCPGPGLVSLAGGGAAAMVFVAAMLTGMRLYGLADAWQRRNESERAVAALGASAQADRLSGRALR